MKSNLFVLLFCVLFFVSCTNPLYKPEGRKDSSSAGKRDNTAVTITFTTDPYGANKSRTVVADFGNQITKWEVTISRDDVSQTSEANEGTVTFTNIQTGNWNVNITGRNNSDAVIALGNLAITVTNADSQSFNIPITFKQTGTGSLLLRFEFPSSTGIDSVSTTIAESPYNANITQNGVNKTAVFNIASIQSGSYDLNFIFKKGEEILGEYREAVNIWDNTLSDKFLGVGDGGNVTLVDKRVFTENDFGYRNANLSGLTIENGVINPAFEYSTTPYQVTVTSDTITFKPVQSIDYQGISYMWNDGNETTIVSGSSSTPLTVNNSGNNTLTIKVTSPDRMNNKTYTFNCVRKYGVIYNGNGHNNGNVPEDNGIYGFNNQVTVTGNTGNLTKDKMQFLKWNTQADGGGTGYSVNSTISGLTADLTLYAEWGVTLDEAQEMVKVIEAPVKSTLQGREVTLSPFEIGKYEVTYELWYTVRKWAESNGYTFVTSTKHGYEGSRAIAYNTEPSDRKTEPVVFLGWINAALWCNAYTEYYNSHNNSTLQFVYYSDVNFSSKLKTADSANASVYFMETSDGFRLPTEAEWEFAARGGDPTNSTNWGYNYAGSDTINDVGWISTNSSSTKNVGLLQSNRLGLYDMSGNAHEWCQDYWFDSISWQDNQTNPVHNDPTESRVVRGGAYFHADSSAKVDSRGARTIGDGGGVDGGFRIARNLGDIIGRRSSSGGIIFYENPNVNWEDEDGWRYLEADSSTPTDSKAKWGGNDDLAVTGTLECIGKGKHNTQLIVNKANGEAAEACYNHTTQSNFYNDWFLPSRDELGLMRQNLYNKNIGGFTADQLYWSSTEKDATNAHSVKFDNSTSYNDNTSKAAEHYYRPIRAFRSLTDNKPLYVVVYDANGGSGEVPVDPKYYQSGEPVNILPNGPTNSLTLTGKNFAGWNTNKDGTGTPYPPGKPINMGISNLVLYAKWTNENEIRTVDDLQAIGVNAESLDKSYILMNDISLSGAGDYDQGWNTIGGNSYHFTGTFDGNGYYITDLKIRRSGTGAYNGLFGYIGTSGTVKNLKIASSSVESDNYAGMIAGRNDGTIENCSVFGGSNSQYVSASTEAAGGIAGIMLGGTIRNCFSSVNVSVASGRCAGGLVGDFRGGSMENCYASGNVTGKDEVGGLVGYSSNRSIKNSYATGNVTGTSKVGGLVGDFRYGSITYSYSTGKVTGSSSVGGLIGYRIETTINSSYYDKDTSTCSDSDGRGIPKTTAEMKLQNTFSDWDFSSIWKIDGANSGYPSLR